MFELCLNLRIDQQAAVEAALDDVGALSITLLDADADTSNEQAILEPAVGETPLWPMIALVALFEADVDRAGLVHVLGELVPDITPEQIGFREVEEQDWTRAWMDRFQPMRFGERVWIYPWNIEPPSDGDAVVVRLDPGLAFGTGTHPTTALCLEWLDGADLAGRDVIDYGCGSGVLAIAAALLGARRVVAVDNDPQALSATLDNAARNGVDARIAVAAPGDEDTAPADVLVANILAGPLHELAGLFAARVKPGGGLALSGILVGQDAELCTRYAEWFDDLVVTQREDWVRITARRSAR
ncbi:MAG TPA: 50S ribosomal protein L11 methyltransferase [Dokdonella sp.]|uniref:50S ribosomal protein L11 methyltransferase n=1 Tax=Dokdonella sp. TaxID=2291710 RepID=UPI0025BB866C|nr:50S ribosomal protein L11 methyltransferase [Dokdonella sp.]MBX3691004.1 50S ribosomal protein L11 methyltransferase [Dokdonella sp.]MCW5567817.1 50S ribosomal protein L11 methyltransferase [Dokdonella sp.]HNR92299.1 50S ribosomal protein L11 methyltransferase [Dokdonella sp.]